MNKYGNKPTTVDGRRFASRREAERYVVLKQLQRSGEIVSLECQPRYRIEVCGEHICDYVADFRYGKQGDTTFTVEDVKGVKTDVYRIKKKLMFAVHGIEVREV